MSKIDYGFKSVVLNKYNDLIQQVKKCQLYDFAKDDYINNGVIRECLKDNKYYPLSALSLECYNNNLDKEFLECIKINRASYVRTSRLKDRVRKFLLNGSCIFVTLTFNDSTLDTTTEKERRVAVTRYLKTFNAPYVANIDYGAKNKREHYHALINCDSLDFSKWHKYGAIKCERVRNKDIELDTIKLSKYVAKLSNHAIKESTHRSALIYSR